MNSPVDAVVMWVDGSDPSFGEMHTEHLEGLKRTGAAVVDAPARHRDNGELRYVLRGIWMFLPWIRRVHLVTNGQRPDWLDLEGDWVRLVTHDMIVPDQNLLPLFNTFAIESFLHRIPGLAHRFLRFSDDFFVGRPAQLEEIVAGDGGGRFCLGPPLNPRARNRYEQQLAFNCDRIEQTVGVRPRMNAAHTPQIRDTRAWMQFEKEFRADLERTRRNRFRTPQDLHPTLAYPYWMLARRYPEQREELEAFNETRNFAPQVNAIGDTFIQVPFGNENADWRARLHAVRERRPLFFNLNDDMGSGASDDLVAEMTAFLESITPDPIPWEWDRSARV